MKRLKENYTRNEFHVNLHQFVLCETLKVELHALVNFQCSCGYLLAATNNLSLVQLQ